jgi:hypothetical protein
MREVCIYQVADGAVSKMLFEGVLQKNLPLLSARAYAYRKDVSAQNAIQYVRSELAGQSRLFVAEYDFSKYFDTIDHDHIRKTLRDHFLLTEVESSVIEGFLRVSPSRISGYSAVGGPDRTTGIPQGTSISLFMANVAAWSLDRELERTGVGFVRYADDTLIWSRDYSQICDAVETLHQYASDMGVAVNRLKSPGIRLLVPEGSVGEMESTSHVDYLGYRLGIGRTSMKPSAVDRIRQRVTNLIYWNLLHEPIHGTQNSIRFSGDVDRDYVSLIWRLRRYLYGDLSERALRRFQQRDAPLRRFKGVMSAYPLIDDGSELKEIDGWILTQLFLAVRKRTRLVGPSSTVPQLPPPHGCGRKELAGLRVRTSTTGQEIDLSVPSVRRIAQAIRIAASRYGPGVVGRADPYNY